MKFLIVGACLFGLLAFQTKLQSQPQTSESFNKYGMNLTLFPASVGEAVQFTGTAVYINKPANGPCLTASPCMSTIKINMQGVSGTGETSGRRYYLIGAGETQELLFVPGSVVAGTVSDFKLVKAFNSNNAGVTLAAESVRMDLTIQVDDAGLVTIADAGISIQD